MTRMEIQRALELKSRENFERRYLRPALAEGMLEMTLPLVPIPATYLIGTDGTIVLGAVDVDYRNRLHSEQLLIALRGMRRRGSA
jgi:hypothetical protein